MALGPKLVRTLSRRRWFGLSIVLAGGAVAALAIAPHLAVAVPLAAVVGIAAGMAFLAGTTLLGTQVADDMRGRTFAFVQAAVRVVLMISIAAASVLGGMGGSRVVGGFVGINASRVLLLVAGLLAVAAGIVAFRRMDDRPGVPVLRDLLAAVRGRPLARGEGDRDRAGLFVVFEGGEGAGKSTQAVKLAAWLRVEEGRDCVLTREPGATQVGARIRGILLDKSSDGLAPRAEALLYAADRAHHVGSVIRPALARGEVVISDRYIDSSLAYQGAGRALPVDEIGWLSEWATGGLVPDLVVLLDVDPATGLARVSERGEADRLEAEAVTFHQRVRQGFLDLAEANPHRYLVLDARTDPDALAEAVRQRVSGLLRAQRPETAPTGPVSDAPVGTEPVRPEAEPVEPEAEPVEAERIAAVAAPDPEATAAVALPLGVAPAPAGTEPVERIAAPVEPERIAAPVEPERIAAPVETRARSVDPAETTAVIPIVAAPVADTRPRADDTLVMPVVRDEAADAAGATAVFPAVKEKVLTSPETTEELPLRADADEPTGGPGGSRAAGTGQ
jgi:dTMP kinase